MSWDARLRDVVAVTERALDSISVPPTKSHVEGWPHPVPIDWETQSWALWYTATDSLSVVAEVLPAWAAHSTLAQVRLILEIQGLVGWLVEPEMERTAKALGLARKDIQDNQRIFKDLGTTGVASMERLQRAMTDLENRAGDAGISMKSPPRFSQLVRKEVETQFPYSLLSDIGVHAGLSYLEQFFRVPDEPLIRVDPTGSERQRCFFLAIATSSYLAISATLAAALELPDSVIAQSLRKELHEAVDEYFPG